VRLETFLFRTKIFPFLGKVWHTFLFWDVSFYFLMRVFAVNVVFSHRRTHHSLMGEFKPKTIRTAAYALQQSSQTIDSAITRFLDLERGPEVAGQVVVLSETDRLLRSDYAALVMKQIEAQIACLEKLTLLLDRHICSEGR